MRQIKTFSDRRLDYMCSYCGEKPDTRDHVPSKILLDEPYPKNLPVVPCCSKCNQGFSLDEEYVACLLECIMCGTTEIEKLKREKIQRILKNKEPLRQMILNSMTVSDSEISFSVDTQRLKNLILKLAKGHAKYENSEPQFEDPKHYVCKPLHILTEEELNSFISDKILDTLPEVGSRALQNVMLFNKNQIYSQWTVVQPDNYSYCVTVSGNLTVKIIIRDFLVAEIIW